MWFKRLTACLADTFLYDSPNHEGGSNRLKHIISNPESGFGRPTAYASGHVGQGGRDDQRYEYVYVSGAASMGGVQSRRRRRDLSK